MINQSRPSFLPSLLMALGAEVRPAEGQLWRLGQRKTKYNFWDFIRHTKAYSFQKV